MADQSVPRRGGAGEVIRHGLPYAGPGEACERRKRHDCGVWVPVFWCAEHGTRLGR
ncbi:hypothetical protein [Streptomyces sp. NPDC059874]|uniref:hypothetical protein n=1 Tax=Streptomyces sp. NPDC059874 TaxID=3346983 RepID=UPI0036493760